MLSKCVFWCISIIFLEVVESRHQHTHRPYYSSDEGHFRDPRPPIRHPHSRFGFDHPNHLEIPIIDSVSPEWTERTGRELDSSAIIFEDDHSPPPPPRLIQDLHSNRHNPSENWNPRLLVASISHPSNRVMLSNVTSSTAQDWFNVTANPNTFNFDTRGSCVCWLAETSKAINCLTNETFITGSPKQFRIPINKQHSYFRISYASTHVYFVGPGPDDFSLLSVVTGKYTTFPAPDPGPKAGKGDVFVIDTLRNLLVWFDYIYFRVIVQPLHQLQSKTRNSIDLGTYGTNTQPTMTLDETGAVLYMFVNLKLLELHYLEESANVMELYTLKNKWDAVIFNLQYFKDNLLWATWSVPEQGRNVTNLWMLPTSCSKPPTAILKTQSKKFITGMLGFRPFDQETEAFHNGTTASAVFLFPRDPWVVDLPSMDKADAYAVSCPFGSQLVRSSNGTDFCEDGPVGMPWTMVVGYIVAPLVILIPAIIYLLYLLTTICKRRRNRYSV